MQFLFNI